MSIGCEANRILDAAESDLEAAVESLTCAELAGLEKAQRVLGQLAGVLSGIESQARCEPSTISRSALRSFAAMLARAGTLNRSALDSINRQLSLAGLESVGSGHTVEVQG